eukprot:scaffold1707_cov357-Prasinococcus_capsulatus_cf.AAC.8
MPTRAALIVGYKRHATNIPTIGIRIIEEKRRGSRAKAQDAAPYVGAQPANCNHDLAGRLGSV